MHGLNVTCFAFPGGRRVLHRQRRLAKGTEVEVGGTRERVQTKTRGRKQNSAARAVRGAPKGHRAHAPGGETCFEGTHGGGGHGGWGPGALWERKGRGTGSAKRTGYVVFEGFRRPLFSRHKTEGAKKQKHTRCVIVFNTSTPHLKVSPAAAAPAPPALWASDDGDVPKITAYGQTVTNRHRRRRRERRRQAHHREREPGVFFGFGGVGVGVGVGGREKSDFFLRLAPRSVERSLQK